MKKMVKNVIILIMCNNVIFILQQRTNTVLTIFNKTPKSSKRGKKSPSCFGNQLAEDSLEHISLQQSWLWLVHLNSVTQCELGQRQENIWLISTAAFSEELMKEEKKSIAVRHFTCIQQHIQKKAKPFPWSLLLLV